ncbi:MAG: hypothetical protein ACYDCQ_05045 [Dehalococcoidia bacterium]
MKKAPSAAEAFKDATSLFCAVAERHGLGVIVTAADKHGSFEWSAVQRGPISRFLALDITSLHPLHTLYDKPFSVEVWIGAENPYRSTRRRTASFHVHELEPSLLDATLEEGWRWALQLTEADLTNEFAIPRIYPERQPAAPLPKRTRTTRRQAV